MFWYYRKKSRYELAFSVPNGRKCRMHANRSWPFPCRSDASKNVETDGYKRQCSWQWERKEKIRQKKPLSVYLKKPVQRQSKKLLSSVDFRVEFEGQVTLGATVTEWRSIRRR